MGANQTKTKRVLILNSVKVECFNKYCFDFKKMGKRKSETGNKPKKKKVKTEIVFDESKRHDFLTGFRKRKEERRKAAKVQFEKKLKAEIKLAKEKAKTEVKEIQSSSHRVVPEIEHLLDNAVSTNIHDLGSHTVSVTHLDLDKKRDKSDESENSDDSSEKEEEKPKNVKPYHKPIDQKTLKKTLAKTNNKLQAFKRGKGGNKFNRKTTKSK